MSDRVYTTAWVPGHATLFFAVPHYYDNPLEMGSIGGGLNFSSGVLTKIESTDIDQVTWNNQPIKGEISRSVVEKVLALAKYDEKLQFEIRHKSELLIGHGLSTSGAGAIGVAISLNRYLDLGLALSDLYSVAHSVEVEHKTGLGSVVGQIASGVELRLSQGGPGLVEIQSFNSDSVIILLMGRKIKTSEVLQSDKQMARVTEAGIKAVEMAKSIKSDYAREFIHIGRKFTEECGLQTEYVRSILEKLSSIDEFNSTMAMIGETILVQSENPKRVVEFANRYNIPTVVTKLTTQSPTEISQ